MSKFLSRFSVFLPVLCAGSVFTHNPVFAFEQNSGFTWTPPGMLASSDPEMVKATRFSTPDNVFSLAWSPDGETLAVGFKESIILYSARGQVLKTYSTLPAALHPDAVPEKQDDALGLQRVETYAATALWWSPDGKSLAARVEGGGIPVWNTETGQVRIVLGDHKGGTLCLAWSPKSDTIATGGVDKLITLFDASTGTLTKTLNSHLFPIRQIAFGKTDDEIVSLAIRPQQGPQNTEIKHWSIAKDTPVSEIMQDYGGFYSALSPQGDVCSLMAPYDIDHPAKTILLCDTMTGQTVATPFAPLLTGATIHLFSPSGNTFTTYFHGPSIGVSTRGPYYFVEGAQTYFTKGTGPIMGFSQDAKTMIPFDYLPASAVAISKKGMIATSTGKTIEIWAPPFG